MKRISSRIYKITQEGAFAVLAKAKEVEARGKNVIHMEIGEPDFDTPENIKKAAMEALARGATHYTPTPGIPELRKAIAEKVSANLGVNVDWKNVLVTLGCKEAVFASIASVVDEGDEVIYPNPGYPAYESITAYAGGKPVPLRLSEENEFRMTPEEVNELTTAKTKAIIINSPHNPCGSVLRKEDVKGIVEIAEDRNAFVISDEIYYPILFDGLKHYSPLSFTKKDNVILVDGFSKRYAMTGWRLGYAVVPSDLVEPMIKLLNNMTSCPNQFVQYAGIEALRGPQDSVKQMVKAYEERRNAVMEKLKTIEGITYLRPQGAFYAFINVQKILSRVGMNSEQLVTRLIEDYGVAVLHGSSMGANGEGFIRISFANSIENLVEGISRLERAFSDMLKR
ncbi:MAG: pyridoxal phosphate-dependent aminotransferase [Nitrososphaerota archaeon]|nr:pyridoxal phosphate-dependent aminotransferase [Aigarchaeota archaeon]MDW8076525.1 pyridoxal phosphate-dependent aminotransferase [Nitrososphaerota archaeon]